MLTWRFWTFLFATVIVLAIVSAIVVVRIQRNENRSGAENTVTVATRPTMGTA